MKVLVLGATGGTGRLIVRGVLAKGHSVVALVREKARADLPGAELIEGDARDETTLVRALNGCDAVVSALGTDWKRTASRGWLAGVERAHGCANSSTNGG